MRMTSFARINYRLLGNQFLQPHRFCGSFFLSTTNAGFQRQFCHKFAANNLLFCAKTSTVFQNTSPNMQMQGARLMSGQSSRQSSMEKLKRLATQYGPIAMATHIVISLCSLGSIYMLIYSGIDVVGLIGKLGFDVSNVVAGSGTFAVAYVIHKLIVPIRVSITVATVPLLVRYLRRVGLFKK